MKNFPAKSHFLSVVLLFWNVFEWLVRKSLLCCKSFQFYQRKINDVNRLFFQVWSSNILGGSHVRGTGITWSGFHPSPEASSGQCDRIYLGNRCVSVMGGVAGCSGFRTAVGLTAAVQDSGSGSSLVFMCQQSQSRLLFRWRALGISLPFKWVWKVSRRPEP